MGLLAAPEQGCLVQSLALGKTAALGGVSAFSSSCPQETQSFLCFSSEEGGVCSSLSLGFCLHSSQKPRRAEPGNEGFWLIGLVFRPHWFVYKDTTTPSWDIWAPWSLLRRQPSSLVSLTFAPSLPLGQVS